MMGTARARLRFSACLTRWAAVSDAPQGGAGGGRVPPLAPLQCVADCAHEAAARGKRCCRVRSVHSGLGTSFGVLARTDGPLANSRVKREIA